MKFEAGRYYYVSKNCIVRYLGFFTTPSWTGSQFLELSVNGSFLFSKSVDHLKIKRAATEKEVAEFRRRAIKRAQKGVVEQIMQF